MCYITVLAFYNNVTKKLSRQIKNHFWKVHRLINNAPCNVVDGL